MRQLTASPNVVASPDVVDALVAVLELENSFRDLLYQESSRGADIEAPGEAYGEYYDELAQFLYENADFRDQRNLEVFSHSYFGPESAWARRLAEIGDIVIPLMLERSLDAEPSKRESALGTLSMVLVGDRLPAASAATIRDRIRSATRDTELTVRATALQSLGQIGEAQDIPLLEQFGRDTGNPALSSVAHRSIDQIRQREPR